MNDENGAFQEGTFSGDWSKWDNLQNNGRFPATGKYGRNPPWLIPAMIGMFLGALNGVKDGGFLVILAESAAGAVLFGFLWMLPRMVFRAVFGLAGRVFGSKPKPATPGPLHKPKPPAGGRLPG